MFLRSKIQQRKKKKKKGNNSLLKSFARKLCARLMGSKKDMFDD